jgi:hypothetical protein
MTITASPARGREDQAGLRRIAAWAGLSALVFAAASLPYLYAAVSRPADLIYTGLMFDVPDHAQYWSWVTASRDGLFISNTMTPEPNAPIFMNPMMWLLARIQTGFGLSFAALFQVWRAGATLLLVAAVLAFFAALVPDRERRRTALWVAFLGSGLGWLLIVVKSALRLPDVPFPMDLYVVEPNTFFGLLAYPHLVLGQALLLLTLLGAWKAYRGGGWPAHLLGGAAALGLALSHPYDLITVYAVLTAFGAWAVVRTRAIPWSLVIAGLVIVACSAPVAFYYQNLTAHDPLWRSVLAQYVNAGVWTPVHVHLVILMGFALILAVAGLVPATPRDERFWFVAIWAAVGLVLIYLPVVYQIKFLGGWQFPIAILAAGAWHDRVAPRLDPIIARWSLPAARRAAMCRALLVLLVLPTSVYLFSWRLVELGRHQAPYYLHRDQAAALAWLAGHATARDVALAPEALGQFVPNYGNTRAYLAHWAMTNRYHERAANVRRFFDPATPDAWRTRLLSAEGVTIVFRAGAVPGLDRLWDPRGSPLVEPLLVLPDAQLYRVRGVAALPPNSVGGR